VVNALATELRVVLGQEQMARQSNKITTISELLKGIYINGVRISVDAKGCQKTIPTQITDQRGDYTLAVKDNQPAPLEGIKTEFIEQYPSEEVERHRRSCLPMVGLSAHSLPCRPRKES